ncbi:hypothetical protein RDWZM_003183 [Blomia tropicalis]|uniref:Cytochrome c oxidase copper chaperone n=1 Tax=Blomia tropicalis TaxID=40697 RepID=A0A9Q0MGE6_BLOTA|nr:Cytochrome c oxidase copper chaperone [Blomia tropicalis]KAJ6224638.1 hypothetical protein RDWZM_003183 [Blomia tropicalis]
MPCDGKKELTNSGDQVKSEEKKLKPCCACPETRKKRDTCIIENGEANCTKYIEEHKECLRSLGFKI